MKKADYVISRRNKNKKTVTIDKIYEDDKEIDTRYVIHTSRVMFENSYTWTRNDCIWAIMASEAIRVVIGKPYKIILRL